MGVKKSRHKVYSKVKKEDNSLQEADRQCSRQEEEISCKFLYTIGSLPKSDVYNIISRMTGRFNGTCRHQHKISGN